jgi:hypothetical protein
MGDGFSFLVAKEVEAEAAATRNVSMTLLAKGLPPPPPRIMGCGSVQYSRGEIGMGSRMGAWSRSLSSSFTPFSNEKEVDTQAPDDEKGDGGQPPEKVA